MTQTAPAPEFKPVSDHAVLVEFASEISDAANESVIRLDRSLGRASITGVTETVPAFVNLLVVFDPLVTDHGAVEAAIRELLPLGSVSSQEGHVHEIPVCYDGGFGMDLKAVAAARSLTVEQVIETHLAGDYRVRMYGFAPGYAYLSGVPESIQVPRKTTAVRGIAAGSVIIAGPQCLITTLEMPTGWSILGASPTRILRSDADPPVLFDVGDRVRFVRVDAAEYERLIAEGATVP